MTLQRALVRGVCALAFLGAQQCYAQSTRASQLSASPSPVAHTSAAATNASTTPQNTVRKKKKAAKPKSPACASGCKPDTTAPALDAATPEDAAAQKELTLLARDVHHGTPGSYEKLAGFANKNSASVWGQRAALALGYEEYSHAHAHPAWLSAAS